MKKSFFKPFLIVATIGLLSVSLAGCQNSISLSGGQQSPNFLQVASEYQDFLGRNTDQALVSQRQINKNLQKVLSTSLIPAALWKYLDNNLLTPNMLEAAWPSVVALKTATSKYPAFSDANIQQLINQQRQAQKLDSVEYDSDTLALFRLLFLQNLAQQAGLPPAELQNIMQIVQNAQPKNPNFGIGTKDSEISNLITQGTQNAFRTPVMKPQVARGVLLQGYGESAQKLLSQVRGG